MAAATVLVLREWWPQEIEMEVLDYDSMGYIETLVAKLIS